MKGRTRLALGVCIIAVFLAFFFAPVISIKSSCLYSNTYFVDVPPDYLCPHIDGSLSYVFLGIGGNFGPLNFGQASYRVLL
jgi:hypothetical protein